MATKLYLAVLPFAFTTSFGQQQVQTGSALDTVIVTGRAPSEISQIAASMSVVDEERVRDQLAMDTNVLSSLDVNHCAR